MIVPKCIGGFAAFTLIIAGCGGDDDDRATPSSTSTTESAATDVTVILRDTAPLDVLYNHDDVVCTTVDFTAAVNLTRTHPDASAEELFDVLPPVQVTLRDADGAIVATESLKGAGGSYDGACEWPVEFDQVPSSAFYEATVSVDEVERTATSSGGNDVVIDVAL